MVTEARARKQTGYTGKDVWKEDLQPRAAVRARTIPLLEQERDRLMAELAEVSFTSPVSCSKFINPVIARLQQPGSTGRDAGQR